MKGKIGVLTVCDGDESKGSIFSLTYIAWTSIKFRFLWIGSNNAVLVDWEIAINIEMAYCINKIDVPPLNLHEIFDR